MNNRKQIAQEFFDYTRGKRGSFAFTLFELIERADPMNRVRISQAFPEYVHTFQEWQRLGERYFDQIQVRPREKAYIRRVQ